MKKTLEASLKLAFTAVYLAEVAVELMSVGRAHRLGSALLLRSSNGKEADSMLRRVEMVSDSAVTSGSSRLSGDLGKNVL